MTTTTSAPPAIADDSALPRSAAADLGVDPDGVVAFLDAVERRADLQLHSLMLLRHGQVFAEAWWAPYRPEDAPLLYSLSKSFTSTALGFAVAEDRLALADRVVDLLPPAGPVGPRTRRMTVANLAAMATGHRADAIEPAVRADPRDPARGFLAVEPDAEPGSVFAYNNAATYTLAALLQRLTGQTLTEYLTPRLFAPLGVVPGSWDQLPPGREIGFSGLHLPTEALARFGQLYLAGGVWQGRQVLPAGWTEQALALHTPNPAEPNPDWRQGYGYQFWRGRHGSVRGDGAYGQFCVLLPEQDAVLVTTAGTENMQGILDAAWTHLLPAFDDAAPAEGAAERLTTRLTGLEVGTARRAGGGLPAAGLSVRAVERRGDGWRLALTERPQRIARGVGAAGQELTVTLDVGGSGWERTDLPVVPGRGLRVAARGSETDGTLSAEVVLVETPHRLHVVSGPAGSSVAWHTAPLGDVGLLGLSTPRG